MKRDDGTAHLGCQDEGRDSLATAGSSIGTGGGGSHRRNSAAASLLLRQLPACQVSGRFCVHRNKGRTFGPARTRTLSMAGVERAVPVRFLTTVFEPEDWVAIFLKSYESGGVAQRVGPVSWIQSERFQQWLIAMNARKYNVFVSVNGIASGRRCRTRDAIGAVRHVFLDADCDGPAVLSRVGARGDLPSPSYVLHSTPNRVHLFWRVTGFDHQSVERLQKQLASELHTDPAATPVTQNTRLPGSRSPRRLGSSLSGCQEPTP
jgi:hypothetical protein